MASASFSLVLQRPAQPGEVGGGLGMILAVPPASDFQRLPVGLFRVGVLAQDHLDLSQGSQVGGDLGVPLAMAGAVERQHPPDQGIGGGVMAGVEVGVAQLAQVGGLIPRAGTGGRINLDHPFHDPDGFVVLPPLLQRQSQRRRGIDDARVIPREGAFENRQSPPDDAVGLLQPGLVHPEPPERNQPPADVGAGGVFAGHPQGQRPGEERVGAVQLAQPLEDGAECLVQLRLYDGLAVERGRLTHAAIEQRHHPQAFRRRYRPLAAPEQVQHEALDPLGAGRLRNGGVARRGQPDGVEQHQPDDQRQYHRRSQHGGEIPPHELSQPVAHGVGARLERLALEIAVHLVDERVHVAVAASGVLVHRGEAEHVEVGPGGGAQSRPEFTASGRLLPRRQRRPHRFLLGDQVGGRFRGPSGQVEGEPAAEQLVQHHAQRVDIGVHADAAAPELLRRGVGGGQRPEPGSGLVLGEVDRLQLLGDAEVEQLHHPVGADQDVGRLDVAVDDGVLVGVANCLTHGAEQPEPLGDAAVVRAAPVGERQPVHVFHGEPRGAVGQGVGVVQPGDAGIVELGEGALLGKEALPPGGGEPGVGQDLDRRPGAEVGAVGQVDHPHAAFAQDPDQPVGPEQLLAELGLVETAEDGLGGDRNTAVQHRRSVPVVGEHPHDVGDQLGIRACLLFHEGAPVVRIPFQRLVEQRLHPLPPGPVHGAPLALPWSS